jgi:hypothetical protein
LRPLLDDPENPRLLADREWIALERNAMRVDILELFERAESVDADITELAAIWQEASNQLLLDCELPNIEKFALWLDDQRRELDRARGDPSDRGARPASEAGLGSRRMALFGKKRLVDYAACAG